MDVYVTRALALAATAISASGCTALDLSQIEAAAPSIEKCVAPSAPVAASDAAPAVVRLDFSGLITGASAPYVAPPMAPVSGAGSIPTASLSSVGQFEQRSAQVMGSLPPALQKDAVVNAVYQAMVKAVAEAQKDRQVAAASAAHMTVAPEDVAEVESIPGPSSPTHGQVSDFAKLMTSYGLRPTIQVAPQGAPNAPALPADGATTGETPSPAGPNALPTYFMAYYGGKFYDRLGVLITKPTISLTVTDAEIASALTVLIEYLADLWDPTPVLGDTASPVVNAAAIPATGGRPAVPAVKGTMYYIGNNQNEPTVLAAYPALYKQIPADSTCGWNQKDAPALGYVANAAGDAASTTSGLVTGSFGGFEVGLGFLGKFSFGDNETLSTIVKTAATRIVMRATLASAYWAVEDATANATVPAPPAAPMTPPPVTVSYPWVTN